MPLERAGRASQQPPAEKTDENAGHGEATTEERVPSSTSVLGHLLDDNSGTPGGDEGQQ